MAMMLETNIATKPLDIHLPPCAIRAIVEVSAARSLMAPDMTPAGT